MRRLRTFLLLAALVSCASQPESADVPEIAASVSITTAAAVIDERDWLREFRVRYAAVKAASRGDNVKALLGDAEAAFAWSPDVPTVQYLLALAYAADGQHDALRGVIDLAFTAHGLPTDFIPESIVRDVAHDRWLIGSVHQRRIDALSDRPVAAPSGQRRFAATTRIATGGIDRSRRNLRTRRHIDCDPERHYAEAHSAHPPEHNEDRHRTGRSARAKSVRLGRTRSGNDL